MILKQILIFTLEVEIGILEGYYKLIFILLILKIYLKKKKKIVGQRVHV